jgi:hypothetical protein
VLEGGEGAVHHREGWEFFVGQDPTRIEHNMFLGVESEELEVC